MGIERSECGKYFKLTQRGLLIKLEEKHPVKRGGRACYPASENLFNEREDESGDESIEDGVSRTEYMGLVMTLMYIARLTRPDVLMATTYLATRSHCATPTDWRYYMKIAKYLQETPDLGLVLHCASLQVNIWADASYAVHHDGKGHTGYIIYLGDSHARSGKQKLQSTSSTDAEVIAAVEAMQTAMWLREILRELRIVPLDHMMLYQDNSACLGEDSKCKRSKHILTKIVYIKDMVTTGAIVSQHIKTDVMTADVLAKSLVGDTLKKFRQDMMGLKWDRRL
jgi:hypothetical protein